MSRPLFWRREATPAPIKLSKWELSQSQLRLASSYAAFATHNDHLDMLQEEVCRVAAEGLRTDFAKLLVYHADDQTFLLQAGVGWRRGVVGHARLAADVGTAAGFAWHTGQSVISNALINENRFRTPDLLKDHGLARSVNIAIPGEDEVAYGVLEVESSTSGEFTTDDLCFLKLLTHTLAAARSRLHRQVLHDEQATRSTDDHQMSLHEMQHRIRNDLQGICSSIHREALAAAGAEHRGGYDRLNRRVLALGALYDHLLGIPTSDMVEMGAYLNSLCLKIAAAADLKSRGIVLVADTQPLSMTIDRAGRLAIAVNELVANAAEHAFPDSRAGHITVRLFERNGDQAACPVVSVSDDGCGFKGVRPESAGLSFVERLVRGAGGVLARSGASGTEWEIALPS